MPDLEKLKISKPGIIGVQRWNDLVDAVGSAMVTSFRGGGFFRSKGGTALLLRPGAAEGGSSSSHPFQVLTRPKSGMEGQYEAMVVLESSLYKSLRPNDKVAITGLDTWFDLLGNDAIWLGIIFDGDGEITSASIDSWGQSDAFEIDEDAWSGNDGYCEDDGGDPPKHQTSRKLIAYSVEGGDGEPVLTQKMFSDQILRDSIIDGRLARYPFAHEGGYPL